MSLSKHLGLSGCQRAWLAILLEIVRGLLAFSMLLTREMEGPTNKIIKALSQIFLVISSSGYILRVEFTSAAEVEAPQPSRSST